MSALRGKSWQRIGARLYRWKGASEDSWALVDAIRRTLPGSAVFVGRTAAWLHRLDVHPTNPVQVAVAELESRAGLEVRQSDVLDESEEIKGVRVTTLDRTLLDLCAWLPAVEALVVLDMAITRTSTKHLNRYADAVNGRAGASRLRQLAELAAPAESPMETRLRWLLIDAGLPIPEVQTDLYDSSGQFVGRADLYYPQSHLVIEFDGGNHRDRLVSDNRRQNSLQQAGYRVLRFSSPDVYGRPNDVVGLVRAAINRHRAFRTLRADQRTMLRRGC
ncbi:MAG: DUF559 domain-containing protein [Chloroflexi bacterium]|nr:MAG: DUF559 domain-containing protein [Chloroflexota bacterium]